MPRSVREQKREAIIGLDIQSNIQMVFDIILYYISLDAEKIRDWDLMQFTNY